MKEQVRVIAWGLLIAFVLATIWAVLPMPVCAMTGSGTSEDPYMIYDVDDLQAVGNGTYELDAYYELANDIDASETSGWNGGAGFVPIGDWSNPFTGQFDGQGYTIDGLSVNRTGTGQQALFGRVRGDLSGEGRILNVILTNAYVCGADDAGTLIGQLYDTNSYVYNCHSTGQVSAVGAGNIHAGGLIGGVEEAGTVRCCSSSVSVQIQSTTSGVCAGGLIGSGTMTLLDKSFATGNVQCTGYVGAAEIGGLFGSHGSLYWMTIQDCYARGNVSGGNFEGGLIGRMWNDQGLTDNCYSTGRVFGTGTYIGGLIGQKDSSADVTASFWDTETSGQATSAGGTGKNTTEMKTESTFTGAGWDFDTIWGIDDDGDINSGYPYFLWWYDPYIFPGDFTQVVWFQPNAIIEGTELPNRAGASYPDGIITWGTNPDGIDITYGTLIPEEEYNFEPITPGSDDIIRPRPPLPTTDVDTTGLMSNPLYPLVSILASVSGWTERLVWLLFAWLIVIIAMLGVHLGFDTRKETEKPHHFVLTSITGLGLSIVFYTMGIFPLWVIILMAFGLVGAIIWERQPVM